MTETAGPGDRLRASLSVAGRAIATHQVELALAMKCQRILYIVDPTADDSGAARAVVPPALPSQADQAGVTIGVVQHGDDLRTIIGVTDEVLVIADGLLADPGAAVELLSPGQAVLVQPADIGLPLGFERLDLTRAAGGLMLLPGRLIKQLSDLPDDYDIPSALTRLALQAGVLTREVPDEARLGGRWRLIRDDAEAHARDDEWVAFSLGEGRGAPPSEKLARWGVLSFGSSLLHAGTGSRVLASGAALLLLLALGAGWLGAVVLGFALIVVASLIGQGGLLLMRVESGAATAQARPQSLAVIFSWLVDGVIVLLASWPAPRFPIGTIGAAYTPLMLIGLLRLAPVLFTPRYTRWLGDRAITALLLAVFSAAGVLTAGIEVMALLLVAGALIHRGVGTGWRLAP